MAKSKNAPLKKLNFEHAFRPIYYFTRIAGLWPFSIIHDSNGRIQKTRVGLSDILRSILVICMNLTLIFFTIKKLNRKYESSLPFAGLNMFKIVSLLTGTFQIVFDLINRKKLISILRKFSAFDNEVRRFFTDFYH